MFKISLRIVQQLRFASLYCPASVVGFTKNITDINNKCYCHVSTRTVATSSGTQYLKELINDGKWSVKKALRKVGVFDVSKTRLKRNGYLIYGDIADNFDYNYFFKKFSLPDTFHSWFLVMELHVWMALVRLMAEADEGRFLRNTVIEAMWEDISKKSGLLGVENISRARSQIKILNEEFQAALLSYDEGLLSDDIVLAGALWRRFFCRECTDPELIELLVKYVRKQVKYFDTLTREDIILQRNFKWFPIEKEKLCN
ncbi:ubiquinol-cytochrome c reductase complex assembly factor 1 [Lycorma delicatula]|uniref:ubiquinol-cytochrome c reductase complex assembly factor 1 n=1 Tax=Lycorma delicatula TaxID=130591 RepID=UPI003F50F362